MTAPPLLVAAAAVAVLLAAELVARRRHPSGDSGALWTAVAACFGLPIFTLLFVSGWIESLLPRLWARGHHLHADRTGAFGLPPAGVYPWVLWLPAALWITLVLAFSLRAPRTRESARWLAGSAGLGRSRTWIAFAALPLLGPAIAVAGNLGGGDAAFPAAAWSSLVLFSLTLLAIAAGRSRRDVVEATDPTPAGLATPERADWFEQLSARGLELARLASAAPSSSVARENGDRPSELARKVSRLGERGVAGELVEAFERLLDPLAEPRDRRALIFAPDDCGQVEVLAAVADLLERRYLETTLVVVRHDAAAVARRIELWLDGARAAVPTPEQPLPRAAVWVVDAELLSDAVLPRLRSAPEAVRSLGLVVWWQLHEFSGVYAANLWALSRRLDRLVRHAAGGETRTAAFLRISRQSGDQADDFVRRVLPYEWPAEAKTYVPLRVARRLHLYRLVSQERFFERRGAETRELDVPEQFRHPALVAARESARLDWPTYAEMPPEVPLSARAAVGELTVGDRPLREALAVDIAEAGASIRPLVDADALAVGEHVAASGRASADPEHHAAFSPQANPYVDFLLDNLDERLQPRAVGGLEGAARRLVCAEGDERLLRRHVLAALNERPDMRDGLQRDFRREDAAIRTTLDRLAETDALTRREVRFLDQRNRLVIDHRYASREAVDDTHRPLDTVGDRLLEVVDPAAGHEAGRGVRLRLDRERATVLAYPGRIFPSGGGLYEVQPWQSVERALERGFVECRGVDGQAVTWRRRLAAVHELECPKPGVGVRSGRGGAVTLIEASRLLYEETVLGIYRWRVRSLARGAGELESRRFERPLFGSFATRGLLVLLDEPAERAELVALAAAVGPLVTVHLGLEADVLEPVPVDGVSVRGRTASGLALIELFPGGLGVLDALHDADRVLLDLFVRARAWLAACPCADDIGCASCLRSPAALAASGDMRPRRGDALRLLDMLGGAP